MGVHHAILFSGAKKGSNQGFDKVFFGFGVYKGHLGLLLLMDKILHYPL